MGSLDLNGPFKLFFSGSMSRKNFHTAGYIFSSSHFDFQEEDPEKIHLLKIHK